jgi:predicted metal-dependent phosphoesterase TrpH
MTVWLCRTATTEGRRVVRVDLHVHSAASWDCGVEPGEVATRCRSLGLSPVFLTDHDTLDGALWLRRRGREPVVVGQEVTTSDGELIGLFLQHAVPAGLPAAEAARRIRAQGGLVYLQHPYDRSRRALQEATIERLARDIDIVEVHNGRSGAEANRRADDLCAILGVAAGAGSDAHTAREIGSVYVEMEAFDGAADFLAKLRLATIVRRPRRWRLRAEALLTQAPRRR